MGSMEMRSPRAPSAAVALNAGSSSASITCQVAPSTPRITMRAGRGPRESPAESNQRGAASRAAAAPIRRSLTSPATHTKMSANAAKPNPIQGRSLNMGCA